MKKAGIERGRRPGGWRHEAGQSKTLIRPKVRHEEGLV